MRNLVYTVLMVVVAGCGFQGAHPQALDEAERLMQSDPVAALNWVDVSELNDSAVMARWALLYNFQPRKSRYKGSAAAESEMNRL